MLGFLFGFWALALMLGAIIAIIADHKLKCSKFRLFKWFMYGVVIFPVALTHVLVKPRERGED